MSRAISVTLSHSPRVREHLADVGAGEATFTQASHELQRFATEVIAEAGVSYVTVMSPQGVRYTHRDPSRIGGDYLGTIPDTPQQLTEVYRGTLGPSIRVISPVLAEDRVTVLGWVSAGVTLNTVWAAMSDEVPIIAAITVGVTVVGLAGALLGRNFTRRLAGDLSTEDVRDATSAYESIRTLGAAMRAQQHEHGNRLHTAVALLELGRTQQAIDLLTERSDQNQHLVDRLSADATADPTMRALILGKSEQARELGVELIAEIDADAPALALHPVDAISVVGNLIDNACEAALDGEPPRTVHLAVRREPVSAGDSGYGACIEVTDSGPGFSSESLERLFERGFSTKSAVRNEGDVDGPARHRSSLWEEGDAERGIGLALVRDIVEQAGGAIFVDEFPTTFRVTLPAPPLPGGRGESNGS